MTTATLPSPLLDEKQVAAILNVTPGTLSVWRCTRRYPIPYLKVRRTGSLSPSGPPKIHAVPHRRRRGRIGGRADAS